jgi:hypothetical protein
MSGLKHYVILLCSPALLLGGCRAARSSQSKDVVPFNVGDVEPILGQGYDSLVQELRNSPNCISGTPAKVSSAASQINLGQNTSSDSLMREFSGEVKGTAKSVFLDVGAAAGFYRSLNRSSSAWNLVYAVRIDSGSEQLRAVTLSDASKALATPALLQTCGDEYVMQINRGGLLSITLNLDFTNEESRQKWQSQIKLSGSWPEVSKELSRKIENKGMDGTLTIKVNQLGGTPNQSLLAVRSCPLSTVEEFNTCKQRVDELMAYASTDFPKQVDSNPAVLNFVTAPLRNLGVAGLPTVSDEVLKIRANLEKLRQDSLELEAAVNLAKEKNVDMDQSMVNAVTANRDQIKQVAKSCFNYSLTSGTPDFGACVAQSNQLKANLRPINRASLDVNELAVNADSEVGNSVVNGSTDNMTIVYSVGDNRSWDYGKKIPVGIDGIPTDGSSANLSSNALSTSDKLGSLLVREGQSYRRADRSGRVEIAPGESISFVINDGLGDYGDNTGVQQVYWRCVNCRDGDQQRLTYRLRVKASDSNGSIYSRQADQSGVFHIAAYGKWRSSKFNAFTDPQGNNKACGSSCLLSSANSQSLVMKQGDTVTPIGKEAKTGIKSKERAYFLMNDGSGGYGDNQGEIEIILQCIKCDSLKSHSLILDPEENET